MIKYCNSFLANCLVWYILIVTAICAPVYDRIYNLTLCSMLRNEMPDILEWIEHYRLQGVDRIILYDDESFDDTVLIPTLYQLRGLEDFIEMYSANLFRRNILPPHTGDHHLWKEVMAIDHCAHRSINTSQWAMAVDMDEFMYSPSHGTIWAYLESIKDITSSPNPWSNIYVDPIRYGTSGLRLNFVGSIRFQPFYDTVNVSVSNPNTDDPAYPMFTVLNPNRSPNHNLDKDHQSLYDKTCKDHEWHGHCNPAYGKSIWKPEHCDFGHIHYCGNLTKGRHQTANINNLRMNHYALKSRAHVDGLLEGLMKPDKTKTFHWDIPWFSTRYDPFPENMAQLILNGINKIISG